MGILFAALTNITQWEWDFRWYGPPIFGLGGWVTRIILVVFAFLSRPYVLKEESAE